VFLLLFREKVKSMTYPFLRSAGCSAVVASAMFIGAATAQGQWVLAHAFEYGWIVRYEDGGTPVTGYLPEPWHLRYIGPDLAREYHDGGWHTFEEFFGLEPASGYIG